MDENKIIECKEIIKEKFIENEKRYIDYKNFVKNPTNENLYKFLKSWNKGIGILSNYEKEIKEKLENFLYKKWVYTILLNIPIIRIWITNKIFYEIYNGLYNAINKEKKLRIPTVKIMHILYPHFFPLFDNEIINTLMDKKNFLHRLQNKDEFKDFIFSYKNCIDNVNKNKISYKTIDEYLFLKYVKKIEVFNKNQLECFDFFEEIEANLKKCLKERYGNRRN